MYGADTGFEWVNVLKGMYVVKHVCGFNYSFYISSMKQEIFNINFKLCKMRKQFTTSTGMTVNYDTEVHYLDCDSISNENTKVGDILLSNDAVFEVLKKYQSDETAANTGLTVYWHKTKRIDSKPWDPYFSDILKDGFSFQGNKHANVAKFTDVKNKKL